MSHTQEIREDFPVQTKPREISIFSGRDKQCLPIGDLLMMVLPWCVSCSDHAILRGTRLGSQASGLIGPKLKLSQITCSATIKLKYELVYLKIEFGFDVEL